VIPKNDISLPDGYGYEHGFIKQTRHCEFEYTLDYKARQSTNLEMSYLRMGWLAASLSYEEIRSLEMVDIGCGNGEFVRHAASRFARACGYDLCGESITEEELMAVDWGLVVLSDVLEHMEDIGWLFTLKWRYAMISFPETPRVRSFDELRKWRHFKPNEHLFHLDKEGLLAWMRNIEPDIVLLNSGNFEDLIRSRWDESVANISTVLVRRPSGHEE
jgi:hypothetical protein